MLLDLELFNFISLILTGFKYDIILTYSIFYFNNEKLNDRVKNFYPKYIDFLWLTGVKYTQTHLK